ncbi:Cna B-type domain-containing protein [Enterococcus sp. AZ177]|uniref:Cna B-type domain-containing protein n=1 Tax=unclassified Enterococcus TaxID=2608891 RepID=UPI003D2FE42E
MSKKKYVLSTISLLSILLSVTCYFFNTSAIFAKSEYNGDKYVINTQITDSSSTIIGNNGTMEINEIYNLDYEWRIPDNTYKNGDILEFSIPKEFKIVQNFKFNLYKDGNEVARVTILGNEDAGYYIKMQFTTNYVETHSEVSGTFNLSYVLNEKYIQTDGDNTIVLPDKEIVVHVPKPDEGTPGGGSGVGAGDTNWNKKEGDAILANLPESPNETSTVFNWNIGLGRNTLLGKASSFDEIKHIYIEDTPYDQKMVSFGDISPGWAGSYAFEGGFFTSLPWEYGGVSQEKMGLMRDPLNTYYSGFKTDILPTVQKYEKLAQDNNSEFKQYKLEYYTTPLNEVLEDTEFTNDATITIVYNDNSEKVWKLSESQMYNVAEGTITGKTAGVEFQKVDGTTNQGLGSAVFDLYKKNITGNYTKVKSNITSGTDGKVKVDNLTTGDYYFSEIQAPSGYEQSKDNLYFTIESKDLMEPNQSITYKNVGTFKNEPEMTKTAISVNKVWDDQNNQDGKRPQSITVQLYGNNIAVGDPVILNDSNQWKYEWVDLDEKANGQLVSYTVKEISNVSGYQTTTKVDKEGTIVITNTHTPETTKVSGTKTWDDKNNQDGKRPEKIIVNLLADGIEIDQKTVTADNKWNYEFTNLPKYKEGQLIHYTVTEDHVPDYSTEINGTSIKNSYTPGQTSVTVTKAWDDANNQDGKRPNGIMVQLYADGKALGAPVQLNTANQWQHTWAELDEKANGKEIIYSVKELDVIDGYDMAVDTSDIGNIIIKNTHVPEKIVITGTKTWEDKNNQDGIRPKEVTVNLLADGEKVAEKVVTEADNWEYAFSDLPKYKEGKEIQYTVTENHVPEYSVEIDGTNLINHYTPGQTSVTVTKAWNDADNQDGKRPENIMVQLYANEKKQGEPVSLSDKNLWHHTWTELDEKANGQDIIYSVKETSIDEEYGITINSEDLGNVIITNSHVPETIELTGTKTWEDKDNQDGKRPESITVLLLANGVPVNEQDVTAANNWQYTFTNLPKYNNGKEIIYTVMENQVPEYSTEIVGIDLINRYTPGKTSVTVNKAWDDADDQAKKRPEKISVQLYANGEKHGEIVTLSSANNWQYSWTELDEKVAGKEIDYTIKEVDIPEGYTATMNDATKHGILLTNTYQSDPPTPDSPEKEIPTKPTKKIGTIIPSLGEVTTIGSILFGIVVLMLASGLYLRNKRR